MSDKKYLIVMDFLYQKYEIEYKHNMTPRDVIKEVQKQLFPCEQNDFYLPRENEESYNKFCLYCSKGKEFKEAEFVKSNIKPEECDYNKFQFYIFRPFINVYLTIYLVLPDQLSKSQHKAKLKLIFPIKKKVKLLKNYLKENIQKFIINKDQFKDCPINGFSLQIIEPSRILTDEEYVEQSMNGKEIFLIINSESAISQNFYMPGRFYYIQYDPSNIYLNSNTESLDETDGFTLDDTRKKLIRKHQEGKNFLEENVLITFNSVMQTERFDKLNDLFCDNDFYKFVVIFETSEININPIPETFQYVEKRTYDIPVHYHPNIIHFEIAGESKPKLDLDNNNNNNEDSINQPIIEANENINNNNDNLVIEPTNENDSTEIDSSNVEVNINIKNNHRDENIEPHIEEEEEVNDEEDTKTEAEEEKLLDMFCFYFSRFTKEKELLEKKTPNPTYFRNLSNDQITLINTFKNYYHFYRQSNH